MAYDLTNRLDEMTKQANNSGAPAVPQAVGAIPPTLGNGLSGQNQVAQNTGQVRRFADGGELDPNGYMDHIERDNMEKTKRWAMDDVASQIKYANRGEQKGLAQRFNAMGEDYDAFANGIQYNPNAQRPGQQQPQQQAIAQPSGSMSLSGMAKPLTTAIPSIAAPTIASGGTYSLGSKPGQVFNDMSGRMGFADGGKPETADEVMARIAAKYGTSGATSQPEPVQKVAQAPAQQPKPQGMMQQAIGLIGNRRAQIDKAIGYANGGKIKGPGTPTSDSIPALVKETGEPIKVSTDERIVSAKQERVLQEIAASLGYETLDQMLEHRTGSPVGPTIKGGVKAAATGNPPTEETLNNGIYTGDGGSIVRDFNNWQANKITETNAKIDAARGIVKDVGHEAGIAAASQHITMPVTNQPAVTGRVITEQPPPATKPSASGAVGYRPEMNGITWNAKGFDPTKQNIAQGSGALAIASGPNAGKNIAIGPQNYTAADGSATSDWKQTAQYAQGMAQAQKDRDTLATMQRDRLVRDATDPTITDPRVVAAGLRGLAQLGIEGAQENNAKRTDILQAESGRAAERFGIERGMLQGQAADSEAVRSARGGLTVALASGDPSKIKTAKAIAAASGITFPKEEMPSSSYTPNQAGMPGGMAVTKNPDGSMVLVPVDSKGNPGKPSVIGGKQQPAVAAPQAGEVRGGYKFKGGNPSDKASWEKV